MGSPIAFQEVYKASMEDFVVPAYESAPFTTIQNRAKVTRSLKAIAGVERVMCRGASLLQNEFGPNGEQIFEADNKDSRIRFCGAWQSISDNNGTRVFALTAAPITNFIEVSFYGTGLDILHITFSSAQNIVVSIDGGAESANLLGASYSGVITGRQYSPNNVTTIVSGLALGWHTAKIRKNTVSAQIDVYGFQILNQRTDLAVYSGSGISNGNVVGLFALTTSAFNAGVSGTRGARVVKYIQGGVVSQAVQEVDAVSRFLTNTDHSNEEVLRRVNFKEFGANRADDFSTLPTSGDNNRYFTLDDGTTTLVGYLMRDVGDAAVLIGSAAFLTITFVGTGLDIIRKENSSIAFTATTLHVDGVSQGLIGGTGSGNVPVLMKICSGLPYGTHTVRFSRNTDGEELAVQDFIIYQSKKPSLPSGALEVADYNLMSNFALVSGSGIENVSSGVLRKNNMREFTYVGANWGIDVNFQVNGYIAPQLFTTQSSQYFENTFWGTGFEIRHKLFATYSSAIQLSLNGLNLTTANFPTVTVASFGYTAGTPLNLTTGIFDMRGTANGAILSVRGLPLGRYTLRANNTVVATMSIETVDVVTPIHMDEKSLKIGNQSLHSVTKYSPEKLVSNAGPDLGKAKAWLVWDGNNTRILSSHNVAAVLRPSTGLLDIYFEKPFKNANYSAAGMIDTTGGNLANITHSDPYLPNVFRIFTSNNAGTGANSGRTTLVFFGELIDE